MIFKHVCEVTRGSDSCLPPLPPNAPIWQKMCRGLQKTTLVSPSNPLCKVYFRSNAAITFERKRHIKSGLLFIIHPLSMFRIYWELWMMVVFLFALIFNPVNVAFKTIKSEESSKYYYLVLSLDFICIIDIVLRFLTGYGILNTKEIVLDPGKIAKNYIFSITFIMDVLSSLPVDLFYYMFDIKKGSKSWRLLYSLAILKIFRLHTLIHYMGHAADLWQISLLTYLIIRYIILLSLVIHWTACLHYIIPMLYNSFTGVLDEKSWIAQSKITELSSNFERYVCCLFRACCYLFNVNHGIYEPYTKEDVFVGIVTFIIGNIFSALLLVLILQIVSSVLSAETKYQEILNQVQEYMGYKQLPLPMQKRLISFYEYRFQKSYFREDVITATLSVRLRREINVYCYRRLVDSVSIFKDVPHHIVVDIVNCLKAEIFLPNDIIVKAGTIGECMYFLASGTVSVVTPTGKEVCHLYDGAYFGEIALIMKDQKRIANVIAIEICEVYRLDRKNFKHCFVNTPQLYKNIEKIAQERREKTLILEELHKAYLMALENS